MFGRMVLRILDPPGQAVFLELAVSEFPQDNNFCIDFWKIKGLTEQVISLKNFLRQTDGHDG